MGTTKRKMNPNSLKNLKRIEEHNARLTQEERRESASRAGKASVQKKRDMRTLKEIALEMLSSIATEEDIKKYNLPEGVSNSVVMTAAAAQKAMAGDLKAYEILRDTAGQMPTKDIQVTAEVFTEANKALLDKVAERIKKEEE